MVIETLEVVPDRIKNRPRINRADQRHMTTNDIYLKLQAEGEHIVTSEGEPVFVLMTVEQYAALLPVVSQPGREAQCVRYQGRLFREVV